MALTEYKRLDENAVLFLVNYLLTKLKNSPLAENDNTTYTIEKSTDSKSFVLKDGDGTTVTTISGLLTDEERAKLAGDLVTTSAMNTAISNAVSDANHLKFSKVSALPAVSSADPNTIYLVKKTGSSGDVYNEYYLQDGAFELIGSTEVDFSGYVLASEMKVITNSEITKIVDDAYSEVFA